MTNSIKYVLSRWILSTESQTIYLNTNVCLPYDSRIYCCSQQWSRVQSKRVRLQAGIVKGSLNYPYPDINCIRVSSDIPLLSLVGLQELQRHIVNIWISAMFTSCSMISSLLVTESWWNRSWSPRISASTDWCSTTASSCWAQLQCSPGRRGT